jgi:hypothetical protein
MSELAIVASQTPPSDHGPTELGICGPITDATTPAQRAVASRWCARPPARASDSRATSVEHTSRHPLHARERRSGQVDCGGVQAVGQGLPLCRALCFRPPPGKVRAGVCPPSLSGRQACLGGATWRSFGAQPACSCRVAAGPIRGAAGAAGDDPRRYRHLSAVASRRPGRGVSPGHQRTARGVVAVLGQPRDKLGANEPGATDNHDLRHPEPPTCSLIGNGFMFGDARYGFSVADAGVRRSSLFRSHLAASAAAS